MVRNDTRRVVARRTSREYLGRIDKSTFRRRASFACRHGFAVRRTLSPRICIEFNLELIGPEIAWKDLNSKDMLFVLGHNAQCSKPHGIPMPRDVLSPLK
jgi:hypothetical protein